jgi:hypothetical protein
MSAYHVSFFKNLVSSDGHPFKCLQQRIDVSDAESAGEAAESASRAFEALYGCPWKLHADSNRVCECHRSGRRRFCRELGTAGRQCDWVHDLRIQHERKMAGAAQRDRARRDAGGDPSGSGRRLWDRSVRRRPDRGAVVGGGVDPCRRARCRTKLSVAFARGLNGGLIVTGSATADRLACALQTCMNPESWAFPSGSFSMLISTPMRRIRRPRRDGGGGAPPHHAVRSLPDEIRRVPYR